MRKLVLATVLLAIGSSMALMAQQPKSTSAPKAEREILVTYFTSPERDGVDASRGGLQKWLQEKGFTNKQQTR